MHAEVLRGCSDASKECRNMATILSFVPRKRPVSRPAEAGSASIIIFPGVRYEDAGGLNHARLPLSRPAAQPKRLEGPSPAHL
jgi:hypothetical protein